MQHVSATCHIEVYLASDSPTANFKDTLVCRASEKCPDEMSVTDSGVKCYVCLAGHTVHGIVHKCLD